MARTEKKTKIKGLPPQLKLTETDSLQGSYPMVNNPVASGTIRYNDRDTIRFSTAPIYYGTGLPVGSPYINVIGDLTSSLTGSGQVVAGIVDSLFEFSSSVPYSAFRDNGQDAADGKSVGNAFYATGSDIPGFDAPLWSKNRIEIDFTPLTASVLSGSSGHWMGYYNFQLRKWDARVSDPGNNAVSIGASRYRPNGTGFTPSLHTVFAANGSPKTIGVKGKPFSNFGFPFDAGFHATSSQLLPVSNYINRPFALEKVVVQISASYTKGAGGGLWDETTCLDYNNDDLYGPSAVYSMCSSSYVVNNFFILNQRRGTGTTETVSVADEDNETLLYLNQTANPNGTIRDLVTWFEVASFNNDYGYVYTASLNPNLFYRDYTIINTGSTNAFTASWSANIIMSSSVRSPNFTPNAGPINMGVLADIDITLRRYPVAWLGSRSGLAGVKASGRDLLNPIGQFSGEIIENTTIGGNPNSWSRANPYIIKPGDQLVFGWQVPTIDYNYPWNPDLTVVTASVAYFPVAPAKVVLYGSYISEGEAVNETLNQVLSSNAIHEALE